MGGGYGNVASNRQYATISGGISNTNLGNAGAIAGGQQNFAGDYFQPAVGGGVGNQANNSYATVPGGYLNIASGDQLAAGQQAQALHEGAFVWPTCGRFCLHQEQSIPGFCRRRRGHQYGSGPQRGADVEGSAVGGFEFHGA